METSVPDKTEEARESESKLVKQISESSGSFGKLLTLAVSGLEHVARVMLLRGLHFVSTCSVLVSWSFYS